MCQVASAKQSEIAALQAMTLQGEMFDLKDIAGSLGLFSGEGQIMEEYALSDGTTETLFAKTVEHGAYEGFDYGAIAISYTNAGLAKIIRTAAFSGKSLSLVIYPDGRIALSTKEGGSVFSNYLTCLRAGSDLSDEQLDQMHLDWEGGEKGAIVCKPGDEGYCISYVPLGYRDFVFCVC